MKLVIINNLRWPTEKAHGYQLAKMAEALADLGHQVTVIYPLRQNRITTDAFTFYHLRRNFSLQPVSATDWFAIGLPSRLAFFFSRFDFWLKARRLSWPAETVVLTRAPELVWLLGRRGYRVFYDVHNWPHRFSPALKFLLRPAVGAVANSPGTAAAAGRYGLNRVLTAPNGVDLSEFSGREREVARIKDKYQLAGKTVIAYAGHFYRWKGVGTLLAAMKRLPANRFICFLVGAGPKASADSIVTVGPVAHYDVPPYLLAADILVLPTADISPEAERYTSPIKLFEYLAAGRPIIASNLPSSRAVISETEAIFFPPSDANALAKAIEGLATDSRRRAALALAARRLAPRYSWIKRAEKVSTFINHA